MSKTRLIIPKNYNNGLDILNTEVAIKLVKDTFERKLSKRLHLTRVSAPLFVTPQSGLNDNLNGVERPVQFDVLDVGMDVQIVHSLAKWKRQALKRYGFSIGTGLYTDMNAIRRDEELDNLHSVYVDQWDWERIITKEQRNVEFLKSIVDNIALAIAESEMALVEQYPSIIPHIIDKVYYITTQELLDRYPNLTPKQREDEICREYKTVFIIGIGGKLSNGEKHDGRAPDYDDWNLNGDLLIWYDVLDRAIELSSMGIRVDRESLDIQLTQAGCDDRRKLPFHSQLLANELPLTIGGGIGQSRLCMVLLQKAHIGEVQSSIWSDDMIDECNENNIVLL